MQLPPPPTYEESNASALSGGPAVQFDSRPALGAMVGLGVRASGRWVGSDVLNRGQGGGGLELLFHPYRRVTLGISAQYQYGRSASSAVMSAQYERMDVPLMVDLRVYLAPSSACPYVVAAAGGDYARATLAGVSEEGWFGQVDPGTGIEWRAGQRFTVNIEVRGYGRIHDVKGLTLYVNDESGNAVPALRNQYGLVYHLGGGVHF